MSLKKVGKVLIIGLVALFSSIGMFSRIALAGFGISPPFVINDRLLQGSHFEQQIILSRAEPEEDLKIEITIDAPEIGEWITIDKGLSFVLPKGEQQVPMRVLIDVPEDAQLGNYKGKIRVTTLPEEIEKKEKTVTIALGGTIRVELAVTKEEMADFKILLCDIPDLEKDESIKLLMKIENTGNLATAPSQASLDVYDKYHRDLLESSEDKELDLIEPFETREIFAEFPTKLEVGSYWGEIKVFKENQIVREEKIHFNILEKKISPPSTVTEKKEAKGFPCLYFYVGAGVVIVLILLIWIVQKRKRDLGASKKKE